MPDGRTRRSDQRRRPSRGAAFAVPPSGRPQATGDGSLAIHEGLLGSTLAQARAALEREGIDPAAQGRAARELAEARWAALGAGDARDESASMDRPARAQEDGDFGAFWAPLSNEASHGAPLDARRGSAGLAWARVSGPRISEFGLAAGDAAMIDTKRDPEPGDAVLIWTGDDRRAIVRLRARRASSRLDATLLGPDDVDDLSATRVVGVVVVRAPR